MKTTMSMRKIVNGVQQFRSTVVAAQRARYERLAEGQKPLALMVTCSDSRIDPNLMTQTDPGELFVLRNAGNIVPPYDTAGGSEAATIEFAVLGLEVADIIVCGHSDCGAMKGLMDPSTLATMPSVAAWLRNAASARRTVEETVDGRDERATLDRLIQANVLAQIENLRTHPAVAARLERNDLGLHAWVYRIDTGEVDAYEPQTRAFRPVSADPPSATNGASI